MSLKLAVCINDWDRLHYTYTQKHFMECHHFSFLSLFFIILLESNNQQHIFKMEQNCKGWTTQTGTHKYKYLVSAILVAITIFLTPGGGLLNTWDEWEGKIRLVFFDIGKGIKTHTDTARETDKERKRRTLTCVWLTVGMRECKGMITNRSETQQHTKEKLKQSTICKHKRLLRALEACDYV